MLTRDQYWVIPTEWPGETAFVVAGGPSVATQPIELLAGRKVIAVNNSWTVVPNADFLFFGDSRWWQHYGRAAEKGFRGRIVTCASGVSHIPRLLRVRAFSPPHLSGDRSAVMMRRSSVSGAINLAVLLGAAKIVLLGVDAKPGAAGRTHHHDPHPWGQRPKCWDDQRNEFYELAKSLRGVEVINASPGSACKSWPVMTLEQAIERDATLLSADPGMV